MTLCHWSVCCIPRDCRGCNVFPFFIKTWAWFWINLIQFSVTVMKFVVCCVALIFVSIVAASEDPEQCESTSSSCGCSGNLRGNIAGGSTPKTIDNSFQGKGEISEDMAVIPGGFYVIGTKKSPLPMVFISFPYWYDLGLNDTWGMTVQDGESPPLRVELNSFLMDRYEVSNNDFAAFVRNTSYVTEVSECNFVRVEHWGVLTITGWGVWIFLRSGVLSHQRAQWTDYHEGCLRFSCGNDF